MFSATFTKMETINKHIAKKLVFLALNLLTSALMAQGVSIAADGIVKVSGAVYIHVIDGNLLNNGTFSNGVESVQFSGTTARYLLGSGSTTMHHLNIANTGGITTELPTITTTTLNIANGCKFTIDSTRAVIVTSNITNNAGTTGLVIKSSSLAANGSLIFNNNASSPVLATVEMYSKAAKVSTSWKWQFIGLPIQTLEKQPSFVDGVNYIRKMNEAGWYSGLGDDKHWIQQTNSHTLNSFTGYEVSQLTSKTYTFTGQLENRDYSSGKLSYTPSAQYPGQHLIGNSYSAAIDISKIEFGSARPEVIENTVYLYNSGSYADWVAGGSGTGVGEAPGQYIGIPIHLAGQNGLPSQISSMQAFLIGVKSNNDSANIKIKYSSVGTTVKNTTMQRTPNKNITSTRIEVAGTRYSDKMWLFTNESCSDAFDNGWDCFKQLGSSAAPQIYASVPDGSYQINAMKDISNTIIGFKPGEETEYTLTFTHENTNQYYTNLYLQDLATKEIQNISKNGSQYSFSTNVNGNITNRFKILTSEGIITNKDESNCIENKIKIYTVGRSIFIENKTNECGRVRICNLSGKFVYELKFESQKVSTVNTDLPIGSFLATLETNSHKSTTKLIVK